MTAIAYIDHSNNEDDSCYLCPSCMTDRAADDRNGDGERFGEVNAWDCDDMQPGDKMRCADCNVVVYTKPRDDYELIDTTDNDCHDTGTKAEMQQFARDRNELDAAYNAMPGVEKVKANRWVVKPSGYSDANFKG